MRLDNPPVLKSKVLQITRAMDAASGAVAYTGVGFQPSALIAYGVVDGMNSLAFGIVDSVLLERGIEATGNPLLGTYDSVLLRIIEPAVGDQRCVVASLDADGFTLTWTRTGVTNPGTAIINVLCLG